MPLNFPPASSPFSLPPRALPAAEHCAGNASASAPSVPVIFRRNGPEEIRQPDNEHVHLVGRDAPSQGSGLLRCHGLASKKRRIPDGPPRQIHQTSSHAKHPPRRQITCRAHCPKLKPQWERVLRNEEAWSHDAEHLNTPRELQR